MNTNKQNILRPSLFDKLIDLDPHRPTEIELSRRVRLEAIKLSIKRDLINLLNTRYKVVSPPEKTKNIESSILNYGLPDLATININSLEKRKKFTRELEQILKNYEPRFSFVKVSYQENRIKTDRTLRFRIDSTIFIEEKNEALVFDSILEPISRCVSIEDPLHV